MKKRQKKKSPTKFIEFIEKDIAKGKEMGFSKVSTPDLGIIYSTKKSTPDAVKFNTKKLNKLFKRYGKYTLIHTHQKASAYPSMRDIITLLEDEDQKTEIIATILDKKVLGYLIMRKTKKTPPNYKNDLLEEGKAYEKLLKKGDNKEIENIGKLLKKILKKYHIQSRWVSNKESNRSIKKEVKDSLENRVYGIIAILFLFFAFIFVSSNITGYSIFNISQLKINSIAGILFIIGLICSFIYLKSKKKKRK